MGILIDLLTTKYAAQEPPLTAAQGILQKSELNPVSELVYEDAEEAHKFIYELMGGTETTDLPGYEDICLLELNKGLFPFPCPEHLRARAWPNRTEEQRTALLSNQIATGALALEEFVLGELFLKASKRAPDKLERAYFYLGDKQTGKAGKADLTLKRAVDSVLAMGQEPPTVGPPSKVLGVAVPSPGTVSGRSEYDVRNRPPLPSYDSPPNNVIDYHADWWKNR